MKSKNNFLVTGKDGIFMCTCITYENGDFYFGRTLDLEYNFGEQVVITPQKLSVLLSKIARINASLCDDRNGYDSR